MGSRGYYYYKNPTISEDEEAIYANPFVPSFWTRRSDGHHCTMISRSQNKYTIEDMQDGKFFAINNKELREEYEPR